MNKDDKDFIIDLLKTLKGTEEAMANYYLACSEAWPDESSFWMQFAMEEEKHGQVIDHLLEIVRANPGQFSLGRPFELSAVETYATAINERTADIRKGVGSMEEAASFALEMEGSLIESRYFEVVRCDNRKFAELMAGIAFETDRHHRRIAQWAEKRKDERDE